MKRLMILMVLVLLGGAMAMAGPTGNLVVSATLQATYTVVSVDALAFGNWSLGDDDKTKNAIITVKATPGTSYKVTLDNGLWFDSGTRRVKGGSSYVPYQIYYDSLGGTEWIGAGVGPTGSGTGSDELFTAYGQLHNNTAITAAPGLYGDTVVVTIAAP